VETTQIVVGAYDIQSSVIHRISFTSLGTNYLGAYGDLTIGFKSGSTYLYKEVQAWRALALIERIHRGMSVGEAFNELIRNTYEGVRL
jgi:hypothetical protein